MNKDSINQYLINSELSKIIDKNISVDEVLVKEPIQENLVGSAIKSFLNIDTFRFVIEKSVRIICILIASYFIWSCINYLFNKAFSLKTKTKSSSRHAMLLSTILPICKSLVKWVFVIIVILILLSELCIDILPILLSFSMIGLAISIGSQTLVKDLINGFLALLEGNMAILDCVTIGSKKGIVESLSLRCVHLRHFSGELEVIPFSEVTSIVNHSREYSIAQIQIFLATTAPFNQVKDMFQSVFNELKETKGNFIKGDLIFSGVSEINELGVKFNAFIKTSPDPKKTFESEFKNLLLQKVQENPSCIVRKI